MKHELNNYAESNNQDSEMNHVFDETRDNLNELNMDIPVKLDNIRKSHWISFYTVQKKTPKETLWSIWDTLRKIPEYSYLNSKDWYYKPATREYRSDKDGKRVIDPETNKPKKFIIKRNKIWARNIDTDYVEAGLVLPIPQPRENRTLELVDYNKEMKKSLSNVINCSEYQDLSIDLQNMDINLLMQYIKVTLWKESDHWENASYRFEPWHNAFSYTPFHFLFNERNWYKSPFMKAQEKLWYEIWEIMTDVSKSMSVFIAWMYEKYIEFKNSYKYVKDKNGKEEKVPAFNKEYADKHFPNWYSDLYDPDKIFYTSRMYNWINEQGKGYAKDFKTKYDNLSTADRQVKQSVPTLEKEIVSPIRKKASSKEQSSSTADNSFEFYWERNIDSTNFENWYTIDIEDIASIQRIPLDSFYTYTKNWKKFLIKNTVEHLSKKLKKNKNWIKNVKLIRPRASAKNVKNIIPFLWNSLKVEYSTGFFSSSTAHYQESKFLDWYISVNSRTKEIYDQMKYWYTYVVDWPVWHDDLDDHRKTLANDLWVQVERVKVTDEFWNIVPYEQLSNLEHWVVYFWIHE